MTTLILGLGNELYGDDGIGIMATRELAREIGNRADLVESSLHGIALIDTLIGYDKAIIIDAIQTGSCPAGEMMVMEAEELCPVACPSPHFTGLPEMIALAQELKLDFPKTIKILAVEIKPPHIFGSPMSLPVAAAIRQIKPVVRALLDRWEQEPGGFGN